MNIRRIAFRCDCGKIHCAAGVGLRTVCLCGRRLFERALDDAAVQESPAMAGVLGVDRSALGG